MLILVAATQPPAEVTGEANTLIGWAAFVVAALATVRLMYIGGKWGLSRVSGESFTHTATEITLTVVSGVLAASAGLWVQFLQTG